MANGQLCTLEYKKEVALYYLSHPELTVTAVANKFSISRPAVRDWVSIFAEQYQTPETIMKASIDLEANKISAMSPTNGDRDACNNDCTTESSKDEEIKRLKEELRYQQLRADAYDELINVAEAKFHISIRKKAGAKQ